MFAAALANTDGVNADPSIQKKPGHKDWAKENLTVWSSHMRASARKRDFLIPQTVMSCSHSVYLLGLRAGVFEVDPVSGWYRAFDAEWKPLGIWSTEGRAVHAIGQDLLRRLYPAGKVAR